MRHDFKMPIPRPERSECGCENQLFSVRSVPKFLAFGFPGGYTTHVRFVGMCELEINRLGNKPMHVRKSWIVFACLSFFASVLHAEDDPFAAIPRRIEPFVAQGEISGAVLFVGHLGDIVSLTPVGTADLEHDRPMKSDTMFRIASMTKPITATAVMILADEGKLSVDDPVEKYIPAFADAKLKSGEPVHGLTIRHLLTHTSGLVGEQTFKTSLEAEAEALAKRPFGFQPGEKWEYGPSMNVCGRIVEIVSGQPYDQFVVQRILQPLGMDDTTFYPTDDQWQRVAVVYEPDKESGALVPAKDLFNDGLPGSAPNPSGGLFSTASNMFRFYQMVLNGGKIDGRRIVSAEAVRAMTTPQTGDLTTGFTPGNAWGLGWCVVREPQEVTGMLSPGTFGHGGLYGTQGWVDPERQAIFVLMIQRAEFGNSDASDVRREFQRAAVEALESN